MAPAAPRGRALRLAGSWVAIVTPFKDDAVDRAALTALVDWHSTAGTDAIVACGTTGESPTLSHEEHDRVVEWTIEAAKGRLPVVAGTGSNSTVEAVRLTRAAAAAGASASLQVNPYYNKPGQEGLYRHFATVAQSVPDLPIVLYNIPGRTGVKLEPATLKRLAGVANIMAIKEAAGAAEAVSEFRQVAPRIAILSGDDALTLPMMALGATGVISVAANVVPDEVHALAAAAERGDFLEARRLHDRLWPLFRALFVETNPIPVKAAVAALGRCRDEVRLPLTAAAPKTREGLLDVMRALGLPLRG